jgi:peptidoglycan/LPS O-acetylase OafA/YrhL
VSLQPATTHKNNFGLLRLVFAALVIVSHSYELIDGNRAREPLTLIFGTYSVAEIAVAGFFIVSGYLIAQSFTASMSVAAYLLKRVLRIYPAYVAASLFCIILVGPLAGADLAALSIDNWAAVTLRVLTLQTPKLPNVFAGQHYPSLNGSMWTIAYEFRCYLLLPILGYFGLLKGKIILPLTSVLWIGTIVSIIYWPTARLEPLFGSVGETLRLTALFLTGTSFFLYRRRIVYVNEFAALATLGLVVGMFSQRLAGPAVAVFGGYLVFWFAFLPNTPRLNAVNSTSDLSYGIYLYAWPLQMLLIRHVPAISPIALILLATLGSTLFAYFSWTFIEQPAMNQKKALLRAV